MEDEVLEEMTERKYLCGFSRERVPIDMEKVYRMIDSGKKIKQVAAELGVSVRTLQRRHTEYQKQVRAMKEDRKQLADELPPLPGDLPDVYK